MDKKAYILKTSPEMIQADPEVLARLQAFIDHHMNIGGQLYDWSEKECYGKHRDDGADGSGMDSRKD